MFEQPVEKHVKSECKYDEAFQQSTHIEGALCLTWTLFPVLLHIAVALTKVLLKTHLAEA